SWGGLGVRLDIVDRRRGLAASLARAGLMITQINDRPVAPVRGTVTRQPRLLFRTPSGSFLRRSPRQGSASGVRGDFQVRFDGRKVAEAVLQRLRQAGVQGGEERRVRLKIESPLKDRRRVGGEVRLLVRMPPGG
ncbi:MAG: hypothetical protein ACE5ID_02820, partial [Acidobacteriota bacterium]